MSNLNVNENVFIKKLIHISIQRSRKYIQLQYFFHNFQLISEYFRLHFENEIQTIRDLLSNFTSAAIFLSHTGANILLSGENVVKQVVDISTNVVIASTKRMNVTVMRNLDFEVDSVLKKTQVAMNISWFEYRPFIMVGNIHSILNTY